MEGEGGLAGGEGGAAPEAGAGAGGAEPHGGLASGAVGWGRLARISRIGRIRPIGLIFLGAVVEAGGGEGFGVAAALDEGLFQGGDLLVEEVVGLVDQADEGVGGEHGIGLVEPWTVDLPTRAGAGVAAGGEGGIGLVLALVPEGLANGVGLGAFGGPEGQVPLAEEILVVQEQFLEGGAGDVGEVQLGLRAGGAHAVSLGDVLATGAGGLDHLVVGPGASVEMGVTEADGAIVDEGGDLEGAEGAVTAAGSQLARVPGWGWGWGGGGSVGSDGYDGSDGSD